MHHHTKKLATDFVPPDPMTPETEQKSKTQKKKEVHALQELGEKLVNLSAEQIKEIDLPQEIFEAVNFAKTVTKHGARRRQMQYIGALMREIDPAPIQKAIEIIEHGDYHKAIAFKQIERWRDDLIAGDTVLLEEIVLKYPDAERQQIAQLVRNSQKELALGQPPKSSRSLFRYLKQISYKALLATFNVNG